MPKPTVKSVEKTVNKWKDVTPGRASYYEEEASVAGSEWEKNTKAAEGTYKTAVAAANIGKRFSGGVSRVGGAKYERKVKDVGVSRFGPGIEAAEEDYRTGVEWVLAKIATIDLPARRPRGDPGNKARVGKIMDELHKARLARLGAGVSAS